MSPLPEPLAPPLHILPPGLLSALFLLLLAALLSLFLWWLRRRRRSRPEIADEPPVAPPRRRVDGGGFGSAVDRLLADVRREGHWREGSHRLAAVVKTRLEQLTGLEMEEMTVSEIGRHLDDGDLEEHLRDLRELQFGRRPPDGQDLERACDRSKSLLGGSRSVRLAGSR